MDENYFNQGYVYKSLKLQKIITDEEVKNELNIINTNDFISRISGPIIDPNIIVYLHKKHKVKIELFYEDFEEDSLGATLLKQLLSVLNKIENT
jgi:hypothetical protein